MNDTVTVVGGGLAGLVAAVTAAEQGADVELHEARSGLGGRARTAAGPWRANWGPHALYCDGPLWRWLVERDVLPPVARPPAHGFRFRHRGVGRRTPPAAFVRSFGLVRTPAAGAPEDVAFRDWVAGQYGDEAAALWSSAAGVITFSHDPGAVSAAFVWERLRRNLTLPPIARYPIGGWAALVDRLSAAARARGVRIATTSPVDAVPTGPTVLAVELAAARRLLGDDSVACPGARTALLDVGLRARRGDAFIVSDLDESGWAERFSAPDPTLAPEGHSLVQAQIGLRPGEELDVGVARLEALLDAGFRRWREREVWRRRAVVDGQTGALDAPGTTWRDRPAVDRGEGVWLAGDAVAAPGLLAEVSWASAVEAGTAAAASCRSARAAARR